MWSCGFKSFCVITGDKDGDNTRIISGTQVLASLEKQHKDKGRECYYGFFGAPLSQSIVDISHRIRISEEGAEFM